MKLGKTGGRGRGRIFFLSIAFFPGAPFLMAGSWDEPARPPYDAGLSTEFRMPDPVKGKTLNILDFGATPNQSADDDGPFIQKAIDAATPGDEVFVPDGTFHIKRRKTIQLKRGVGLRGASHRAVLSAQFIAADDNKGSILVEAAPGVGNLTLSNLKLEMSGGQELNYALWLGAESGGDVDRIAARNLRIVKFSKMAISVRNGHHILIRGNVIRDAVNEGGGGHGYGIMLGYDRTHDNRVDSNRIGPHIRHGVLIQYRAHHNLVEHNLCDSLSEDAFDLHGEDEYSNEIRFNRARNSARSGIGVGNTGGKPEHYNAGPNNWIHHNEVSGCRNGIQIYRESHHTIVEDNYFHDNTETGILIYNEGADYIQLRRNRVEGNAEGVRIENALHLVMENNTISKNRGSSLKATKTVAKYAIRGNDFRGNGARLEIQNPDGIFENNLVEGATPVFRSGNGNDNGNGTLNNRHRANGLRTNQDPVSGQAFFIWSAQGKWERCLNGRALPPSLSW